MLSTEETLILIEKAKQAIDKFIKNLVAEITEDLKNQFQKQK